MVLGLILVGVAILKSVNKPDYSKPWWEGAEVQQVCTSDGSEKCYTLHVTSDGESITQVSFPNGGYLYGDSECHEAADIYTYDQFCRFYDQEGRKWDVIPAGH